jgi:hypothetical protein
LKGLRAKLSLGAGAERRLLAQPGREREELDVAVVDLGAFGLELELAALKLHCGLAGPLQAKV